MADFEQKVDFYIHELEKSEGFNLREAEGGGERMGGQFLGGYNTNSRMASKSQCFNSDCGRRAEHPEPLSEEKRAEKWNDIGEERTMRSWPSSYRLAADGKRVYKHGIVC